MKKLLSLLFTIVLFIPFSGEAENAGVRCPKPSAGQIKRDPLLFDLLPEDVNLGTYIVPNLVLVSPDYTIERAPRCLTRETYQAFLTLTKAMEKDIGRGVFIRSAWRSFETQKRTLAVSPELAALPGKSEHQLGTAIDFSHTNTEEREELFVNTPQYQWMALHAHEYGFVQTYGENSILTSIVEPWHFRYVGVPIATDIVETSDDPVGYIHRLKELRR